jgi:transcriptional regulator with XRE-family HTH domain
MKQSTQRNRKRRAHPDLHAQETLGERCYRLRNALGLTLRAVARGAGISAPYMSDIEHDRRCPSDEVLRELAGMLHVSRETLEAPMLNRDALRTLNADPELVRLIRLVMSDRHCRCLVLDAAGLTPAKGSRR